MFDHDGGTAQVLRLEGNGPCPASARLFHRDTATMARSLAARPRAERGASWTQQKPALLLVLAGGFLASSWSTSWLPPSSLPTAVAEASSSPPPPARPANPFVEGQSSNSSRRGWDPRGGDRPSDDHDGGGTASGSADEIESSSEDESLWGPPAPARQVPRLSSPTSLNQTTAGEPSAPSAQRERSSQDRVPSSSGTSSPLGGAPVAATEDGAPAPVTSQPLQTLEKLRHMLDETDYLTASTTRRQQPVTEGEMASQPSSASSSASTTPTTASSPSPSSASPASSAVVEAAPPRAIVETGRLWTSKDRAKYKKQQQRLRKKQEEMLLRRKRKEEEALPASRLPNQAAPPPILPTGALRGQPRSPPIHLDSDDDRGQLSDDTDDGLGYSLPNVPVYFSDAEGDSDPGVDAPAPSSHELGGFCAERAAEKPTPPSAPVAGTFDPGLSSGQSVQSTPNYYAPQALPHSNPGQHAYGQDPQGDGAAAQQFFPPHQVFHPTALPYMYYPSHYGPYLQSPPHPGHFGAWNSQPPPPPGFAHAHPSYPVGAARPPRQYHPLEVFRQPPPPPARRTVSTSSSATPVTMPQASNVTSSIGDPASVQGTSSAADPQALALAPPSHRQPQHPSTIAFVGPPVGPYGMAPTYFFASEKPQSLAEASSNLSFESIERISLLLVAVALSCYAGVSPRTLPLSEYNLMFYENLRLVSLALIAPSIQLLSVFDARENDINALVNTFFVSFTLGYVLTFAAEIVATTVIRLAVFHVLEPKIFSLAPIVPVPVLPWVLRDIQYRPKRITLFVVDFVTSCVACPMIEEYIKLVLLRWTTPLPRNFNWVTRVSTKNWRKKRSVAEPVPRVPGEKEATTASKYVTQMLAVSLGLKLCDGGRRILLYTKAHQADKSFFAIFRGIFPIQELCGTLTALALAKRDLLGFYTPLWQILGPAVVLHGMANYRGMKPIFKWNSATPWSEMQLYPLHFADSSTLPQLLSKGFGKFMWLVILGRVLGYCIKNYYMVNRQAVKRATTYAGKHSAFSAELATAELLKKQKQK